MTPEVPCVKLTGVSCLSVIYTTGFPSSRYPRSIVIRISTFPKKERKINAVLVRFWDTANGFEVLKPSCNPVARYVLLKVAFGAGSDHCHPSIENPIFKPPSLRTQYRFFNITRKINLVSDSFEGGRRLRDQEKEKRQKKV